MTIVIPNVPLAWIPASAGVAGDELCVALTCWRRVSDAWLTRHG